MEKKKAEVIGFYHEDKGYFVCADCYLSFLKSHPAMMWKPDSLREVVRNQESGGGYEPYCVQCHKLIPEEKEIYETKEAGEEK